MRGGFGAAAHPLAVVAPLLAALFAVAGAAAAFLLPGRPRLSNIALHGTIYGFTVSTAFVILQRLILSHFFERRLLPTVDTPVDLFVLAGWNAVAFFAGFVAGQGLERFAAPWRAARRRDAGSERPLAPPPPPGP